MNGLVFKQRYKPANVPSSPVLNQKHIEYIATRKGTICNEGCGFGLWGKMPTMFSPANIDDLKMAKKVVGEASRATDKRHARTLYRVILSADEEMAVAHGLHGRERWEELVNAKIDVLAKEMNIESKNFCWLASMHYKKTHPHVHIVYWDNGAMPRKEFVPKAQFERMADNVRATFNRELVHAQIRDLQSEQTELSATMRTELRSALGGFDTAAMLNIDRISTAEFDALGKGLCHLVTHPPPKGSFRYKTLKGKYKEDLDAWLDTVMKIPQFHKLEHQYCAITNNISKLYGNGTNMTEANLKKARADLRNKLGNEVLSIVRNLVNSDEFDKMETFKINPIAQAKIEPLLNASPVYQAVLDAMPTQRTPWRVLKTDENFIDLKAKLVYQVAGDVRVRKCLKLSKDDMKTVYRTVNQILYENIMEDKTYNQQAGNQMAMRGLLRLFCAGGEQISPASNHLAELKNQKNMSDVAKKDMRQKRSQAGTWEYER